jgi:1-deoxy-D-xylulose-5-phosphate synthase
MSLLGTINSPQDVKALSPEQLVELAVEIRERLVEVLSETGGHLAPNLGVVELTLALHTVFDTPEDKLIWDVSHQSYVHKLITGRREQFHTIRQHGGLYGYARRSESEHDPFGAAHASTAISAALGFAEARDRLEQDHNIVAIVGDGAMTGGLAYEGLNNLGASGTNMLIILNDNDMSIAPNVGAIHEYFTTAISNPFYNKVKDQVWEVVGKVPAVGKQMRSVIHKLDESLKNLLVPGLLFERLGIRYFGPVDGHDVEGLIRHLRDLKSLSGPKLLHIKTVKGKGYEPAEKDSYYFHGAGAFDKTTGDVIKKAGAPSYTSIFGSAVIEECRRDPRVLAITGAMPNGTGLDKLCDAMPERFFDVGIAEAHGVCFSAGLAAAGMKPIAAIYSTFLQRAYDQIIHDVALQELNVFFCMDRGGLVGADGPTHHGALDLSYLRCVPNMVIMAPKDENELVNMLRTGLLYDDGPIAMRYPRGTGQGVEMDPEPVAMPIGKGELLQEGEDVALIAVGRMVTYAREAADLLSEEGVSAAVVNARFVKPLDAELIGDLADRVEAVITIEENAIRGGFGAGVLEFLSETGRQSVKTLTLGLPDAFVGHGDLGRLLEEIELDAPAIARRTLALLRGREAGVSAARSVS